MALIAKSGTPSLSSVLPPQTTVIGSGLKAGEDIAAGDACYIAADGTIMRSNGTAATASARADGIAAREAVSGEAVTLYRYVEFRYGAALTPGARLYVGATAGRLDGAATTGGTAPVALVVDATRIFFHGSVS
jgi:hypothetical protein